MLAVEVILTPCEWEQVGKSVEARVAEMPVARGRV
jgi:hypothetical protein